MSRLCAKPTCSDPAARWFDIFAAQQRVVERVQDTPSSIPLCDSHASRFSAPDGWTIDKGHSPDTSPVPRPEPSRDRKDSKDGRAGGDSSAPDRARKRKHERDAPWFLAGSVGNRPAVPSAPLLPPLEDSEAAESEMLAPTAGSLLHRAFHGPDRDDDVARAKTAERDSGEDPSDEDGPIVDVEDLSTRRAKRASSDTYDIELPFPPFEPARHVAVS